MRSFVRALLFTGLLFTIGCSRQTETGISVDRALKPLVPPDTKVLAGLDIEKLKSAPLYQRHQEVDWNQLTHLREQIGFDPRRDVSDALISWNGKQALVLARGSFNLKELQERLGVRHAFYKHRDLIGVDTGGVVLLKKGVAAAGDAAMLRTMIDVQDAGTGGVPPELEQQLKHLPKTDQVWAVSRGGLPFADAPLRSDIASTLSNIVGYVSTVSAGVGLDTGAHVQAEITCVSDQGAQRVRDALRGGVGLARLTTKDDELDLLRLYDAIHVDQDHQFIHIRADFSADLTDKLIARLQK